MTGEERDAAFAAYSLSFAGGLDPVPLRDIIEAPAYVVAAILLGAAGRYKAARGLPADGSAGAGLTRAEVVLAVERALAEEESDHDVDRCIERERAASLAREGAA